MTHIAVLAGPALGHVSRLFQIFRQVRALSDAKVTFISPGPARFLDRVAGELFPTLRIPPPDMPGVPASAWFADGLETLFGSHRFDLIVHDLNPLQWLALVRFPSCPRIHVTNAFLTGLGKTETIQQTEFATHGAAINRARADRGLLPLTCAFDLYDADRVMLTDPAPLVAALGTPPPHHIVCGHCSWSAKGTLPAELRDRKNLLIASMGSSGRKTLDGDTLAALVQATHATATVYVGDAVDHAALPTGYDFLYRQLPLDAVLPNACAVISQGGAGSTYQALAKGIPAIVYPTHRNQAALGQILDRMGVGLLLDDSADTAARLARLDFATLRLGTAKLSHEMRQQNGPETAAAEILACI